MGGKQSSSLPETQTLVGRHYLWLWENSLLEGSEVKRNEPWPSSMESVSSSDLPPLILS
ncbi:unnamed protein product, partial [Gulo gulo]